jgi:hypothetical protein
MDMECFTQIRDAIAGCHDFWTRANTEDSASHFEYEQMVQSSVEFSIGIRNLAAGEAFNLTERAASLYLVPCGSVPVRDPTFNFCTRL